MIPRTPSSMRNELLMTESYSVAAAHPTDSPPEPAVKAGLPKQPFLSFSANCAASSLQSTSVPTRSGPVFSVLPAIGTDPWRSTEAPASDIPTGMRVTGSRVPSSEDGRWPNWPLDSNPVAPSFRGSTTLHPNGSLSLFAGRGSMACIRCSGSPTNGRRNAVREIPRS